WPSGTDFGLSGAICEKGAAHDVCEQPRLFAAASQLPEGARRIFTGAKRIRTHGGPVPTPCRIGARSAAGGIRKGASPGGPAGSRTIAAHRRDSETRESGRGERVSRSAFIGPDQWSGCR